MALANCPGTKTCTVMSPTGQLIQIACEDKAQAQAEATETKTPLPPPHPGSGDDTPTPGFGEISGEWPVNSRGEPYPVVTDPRTGKPIPPPPDDLEWVPAENRVVWNQSEKDKFITEWRSRGYPDPPGGWGEYDIHHITPRQYGGSNDFENLVPVLRETHQQQLNRWWNYYIPSP